LIGKFIVFEGIDGAGKSTQIQKLEQRLNEHGIKTCLTFEPGDTKPGQIIRKMLFENMIDPLTEAFLFAADRTLHVRNVVLPALKKGLCVISDRFLLSSVAYQGYGKMLGAQFVKDLNTPVIGDLKPDLTIILDVQVDMSLKRVHNANRFEQKGLLEKVREGFLKEAQIDPNLVVIGAEKSADEVFVDVWSKVSSLFIGGAK